jgi:hypothetical protein
MKVTSAQSGYDKVLQFNVYLGANGDLKSPTKNSQPIQYTVNEFENEGEEDRTPDRHAKRGQGRGREEDGDEDGHLSPNEVTQIKQFLHRVKSESGDSTTGKNRPNNRDYQDNSEQEERPSRPKQKRSQPRDLEYIDEEEYGPDSRNRRGNEEGYEEPEAYEEEEDVPRFKNTGPRVREDVDPYNRPDRRAKKTPEDERANEEDGRYLEIFIKPKKGGERLVYQHDGMPSEIVHKFTPKRGVPERKEDVPVSTKKKAPKKFEAEEYEPEQKRPSLEIPDEHEHNRYKPKGRPRDQEYQDSEDQGPSRANEDRESVPNLQRKKKKYVEKQDELIQALIEEKDALKELVDQLCQEKQPKQQRTPQPRYVDEDEEEQVRPAKSRPKDKRPRNEDISSRARDSEYDDEDMPDRRDERRDRTPRRVVAEPPKDVYVKVPHRDSETRSKNKSITPSHRPSYVKSSQKDLSSAPRRKSPFDVDPRHKKTEWEVNEPWLKQHDRLARTPTETGRPSKSPNSRVSEAKPRRDSRDDQYYPRTDAKRRPKENNEFCALCEVYVDKERFLKDIGRNEDRRPRNDKYDDRNRHYDQPRVSNCKQSLT